MHRHLTNFGRFAGERPPESLVVLRGRWCSGERQEKERQKQCRAAVGESFPGGTHTASFATRIGVIALLDPFSTEV
jgi:hypothetical protein